MTAAAKEPNWDESVAVLPSASEVAELTFCDEKFNIPCRVGSEGKIV